MLGEAHSPVEKTKHTGKHVMQGNEWLVLQWISETINMLGDKSNGREILVSLMFFKSEMPSIVGIRIILHLKKDL